MSSLRQISVASAMAFSRVIFSARRGTAARVDERPSHAGVFLTAQTACDPDPAHSTPSKSSSPGSGAAGGPFTTTPGAVVRSTCAWRSMFTRVSASPAKMITGSDHVAHVQRSFPHAVV
jgi:hypothetical protein